MTCIDAPTLRRTQQSCAKATWVTLVIRYLKHKWSQRNHPSLDRLNPHLARDIALSDADLARHNHQWPSQGPHHPNL